MKPRDKMYVITRSDLKPSHQGVQSIHAMRQFVEEHPEIDKSWFRTSNYLVWLSVPDEPNLFELASKASNKQIRFSVFREPDMNDEITALVLEPGSETSKLCRNLSLALKNID